MSETSEHPPIAAYTTCSACRRVVEVGHVNSTGRCVFCAGVAAAELALLMPGAAWLVDEPPPVEAQAAPAETKEPATP